jgi:hypothetical protein
MYVQICVKNHAKCNVRIRAKSMSVVMKACQNACQKHARYHIKACQNTCHGHVKNHVNSGILLSNGMSSVTYFDMLWTCYVT